MWTQSNCHRFTNAVRLLFFFPPFLLNRQGVLPACLSVPHVCSVCGGQERAPDPLGLALPIVSCLDMPYWELNLGPWKKSECSPLQNVSLSLFYWLPQLCLQLLIATASLAASLAAICFVCWQLCLKALAFFFSVCLDVYLCLRRPGALPGLWLPV